MGQRRPLYTGPMWLPPLSRLGSISWKLRQCQIQILSHPAVERKKERKEERKKGRKKERKKGRKGRKEKGKKEKKSLSRVWLFVIPWTVAYQATLSMEFSMQEYWSVLPFPFPGDLPGPGIEPRSPSLQADTLPSELPGKPPCPRPISMATHSNTLAWKIPWTE